MTLKVRAELSEKNKYWIERHRYHELKHLHAVSDLEKGIECDQHG